MTTEREQIERSIAALEAQRAILSDDVVDPAIAALREKLAALEGRTPVHPPETAESPKREQRRLATVLFADIPGFTTLAEKLDPEVVNDLINAFWQRLDSIITGHGGRIDKHIGDAVMALWGTGLAREDDPERAIRAALAMQEEIREPIAEAHPGYETLDSPLALRIGIHTGPVILGEISTTGEYTAIGDTVNTTSRLEYAAPVGGILISHDTYRQVRGVFDVLPQDPITVKGKTDLLQTYIVRQAKEHAFRMATRGIEGVETCMVGRAAELQELQEAFNKAVNEAQTCFALVTGEAGMGKSRLLYEFDNWIELLPDEVYYYKGRATPATASTPYGIIRDLFAYRFGILESDRPATVLRKFRIGMADFLDAERADIVGHLIGFDFSTSSAVQNLLGSPYFGQLARAYLFNYLRGIAKEPTVIFLEDIHWADDSSLELIASITAEMTAARLFVVCLARPSLFEHHPDWGQGIAGCARIHLHPLSPGESRALISEILQKVDEIPTRLHDLIVNGAEGNPFYVEELIKMLIDDGVIVRGEERWFIALGRLKQARVPPTLTGVLQARLDRLPYDEKEILQRASVVGRLFWDTAVAALAAEPEEPHPDKLAALRTALRALDRRELIYRQDRSAFAGSNEYFFRHIILYDVTYETVLLKLRRIYHAQVAQWLEANAGERINEYLGLIARHYELAGENTRAAHYLQRAGEELSQVQAYGEAINAFERALAMLPPEDKASRANLLAQLGNACGWMGDYQTATQHLEAGLPLARAAGDRKTEIATLYELGSVAWNQGEYDNAERLLEPGLEMARAENEREWIARILWSLALVARYQGQNQAAVEYLNTSLEIFRDLGDRTGIARALNVLGMVAFGQEAYTEADRYYTEGLAIGRETGDRTGIFMCLNNLGVSARKQGKYAKALEHFEEVLPIGREIGLRHGVAVCLVGLGLLYIELDENAKAWNTLQDSLKESLAVGATPFALHALVGVGQLYARSGEYTRAAELIGLVMDHSATTMDARQDAEPISTILDEALPNDQLKGALRRGETLKLEKVMEQIIAGDARSR